MTIENENSRWDYIGDAIVTSFPFDNLVVKDTDLNVHLDGVLKTIIVDYTVAGAGTAAGSVDFLVAPAVDVAVALVRDTERDQLTAYPTNGPFPAKSHEDALDKLTIIAQETEGDRSRLLSYNEFSLVTDVFLDDPVALKLLGYSSDGLSIINYTAAELGAVILSDDLPLVAGGAGSAGVSPDVSRDDHVHPSAKDVAEELTGKTMNSFTNNIHADAIHIQARNNTGFTIPKRSAVYVSGATGQNPTIALANSSTEGTSSHTIGLTDSDILNNSLGHILLEGLQSDVDTSAFGDGDTLYLDNTDGGLTNVKPDTPEHLVTIGHVAYSHANNGKIFISIQNGYEIDELHDVLITAIADGNQLQWDAAQGYWKNVPSSPGATLPKMYFSGLTIANGADADHDINVGAGEWRSAADDEDIVLASTFVKQIDATWATGTAAGGLASGAALAINTWYHVLGVNVAGAADIMFDTDIDCANGVANNAVTAYRYLCSCLTDGSSNIIAFKYANGRMRWVSPIQYGINSPGTAQITVTLGTPLDVVVMAQITHRMTHGSDAAVTIRALNETDAVPSKGANSTNFCDGNTRTNIIEQNVPTDTSSAIGFRSSISPLDNNDIDTLGWSVDRSSI